MNWYVDLFFVRMKRSGRRSRQVTPLITIPKVRLLSKMIDGMTSLINIPNILLLQFCPFPITGAERLNSFSQCEIVKSVLH